MNECIQGFCEFPSLVPHFSQPPPLHMHVSFLVHYFSCLLSIYCLTMFSGFSLCLCPGLWSIITSPLSVTAVFGGNGTRVISFSSMSTKDDITARYSSFYHFLVFFSNLRHFVLFCLFSILNFNFVCCTSSIYMHRSTIPNCK